MTDPAAAENPSPGSPVVRLGILGAAKIAPAALVRPAQRVDEASVVAIAARNPERAAAFARKRHVPVVHNRYEDLLADDNVDAVYIPLPNGLHAQWTIKALHAGKHVLCEKPFAANAAEAQEMAAAAASADRVLMEAFHYRYHPLAERMREIAHGGDLGEIQEVRTWMCFPLPLFNDIRYRYDLAGGATMDAGCYGLHCLRLLGPGEPEVVSAHALTRDPRVDRAMTIHLRFPSGAAGRTDTSMWSSKLLHVAARVTGDRGQLHVLNFTAPQYFHLVRLTVDGRTRRFRVPGEPTYNYQLRAFTSAVLRGSSVLTPPSDSIINMRLIDDVYRAAGLPLRGESNRAAA
jgi:predicted dehydrogenase